MMKKTVPATSNNGTGTGAACVAVFVYMQMGRFTVPHPALMRLIGACAIGSFAVNGPVTARRPAHVIMTVRSFVRHPRSVPDRTSGRFIQPEKLLGIRAFVKMLIAHLPLVLIPENVAATASAGPARIIARKSGVFT